MKEHQSIESKSELAKGKTDLEQAQNQMFGGHHLQGYIPCILNLCMDQAISSILYLNQYLGGLLDLGVIGRELSEIGCMPLL